MSFARAAHGRPRTAKRMQSGNGATTPAPRCDGTLVSSGATGASATRRPPWPRLFVDRLSTTASGHDAHEGELRAFLRALTVPREGTEGATATAPPRALVIWPNVLILDCDVASVEFSYRQFSADGSVLIYVANVTVDEIVDARVTSEELRAET